MKLLITGALGHIGSFLADNIFKIKKVSQTILLDNLSSERYFSLYYPKKKNNLSFFLRDLTNKHSLKDFKNVDVIIHLASMTNAERSFYNKDEMYKNNINSFKNIVNYCIKNRTKLIHISSTSVYGKNSKIVDENCEKKFLNPQSPYARIKLIEEDFLKKNSSRLKYNTFRFGTIAGISRGMRFHTAVNSFCFSAAFNKKIKIYKTALHQYRPYLSIRDSFKLFKFCLENNFFENDIFNVVSDNFTVNQILNKIRVILKRNIKLEFVNSEIMNQLSYHVDCSKIEEKGIKLRSNIDIDINNTLSLFKSFKNKN
jgi:UDP-glucose 4-epimerase